jgi:hypothetical protein
MSQPSQPPLVVLDFNALWDRDHVALGTPGVRRDLERQGVRIAEGLRLRGYDLNSNDNGERDNVVTRFVPGVLAPHSASIS